jgi:hypothetical protein
MFTIGAKVAHLQVILKIVRQMRRSTHRFLVTMVCFGCSWLVIEEVGLEAHRFFYRGRAVSQCRFVAGLRLCPVVAACRAAFVPWPCVVASHPAACTCDRAKMQISLRAALWLSKLTLSLSLLVRIPSRRARHNSLAAHADWNPVGDSLRWFELEDQDGAINE